MPETIAQKGSYGNTETLHQRGGWSLWLRWVLATAVGEFVGFAVPATVGVVASWTMWGKMSTFAVVAMCGVMVLAGVVEGAVLGFAQWLVLRRYIQKAGWWVLANAVGWPLGVAVPFPGLVVVSEGNLVAVWILVGLGKGVLMGVVVGVITGIALVWLLRTRLSRSGKHTVQIE